MSRRRVRGFWIAINVAVVATLVALIVPAWMHYRKPPPHQAAPNRPPAARRAPVAAPEPERTAAVRRVLPLAPAATRAQTTATAVATATATKAKAKPRPLVRLVVVAARGACWIRVRAGSTTGRVLWEGILNTGDRRALPRGARLVLYTGAPANLDVVLRGRTTALTAVSSLWLATPAGIRPLRA